MAAAAPTTATTATTTTTLGPTGTTAASGAPGTTTSGVPSVDYVPAPIGEWQRADAAAMGWSVTKLEELVAMVEASNSRTFMMVSGGRILTENYWVGTTAATTQDVASVQKSVTSTLVGIAMAKGLLGLDDPVSRYLAPGWSAARPDEEASITIRHLLTMSSGLHPRSLEKVAEPGTVWEYNTDAYQKLRLVLEAAADDDINHLSRAWIFDTIGMSPSATWQPRPSGATDATGSAEWGLSLTLRDLARFGLLAHRLGTWDGTSVVSESWLREAWTPSKVKRDYGYLWWLLGEGHLGQKGAPSDLVAGLGANDQKLYVIPSLDVVVARQGLAAKEVSENTSDFDARLVAGVVSARA